MSESNPNSRIELLREPAPSRLVDSQGRVTTGHFQGPVDNANLSDAPAHHPFAFLRGTPLSGLETRLRKLRFKQWHYASVVSPRVFVGCAVVDAGYVGTAFVYVVERATGRMYEWTKTVPLGLRMDMAPNSVDGVTRIVQSGWGSIVFGNDVAAARRTIRVEMEGDDQRPALSVSAVIEDDAASSSPVILSQALGRGHWNYTHKCYGLRSSLDVRCGPLQESVAMGEAWSGVDWTCGYRLYETYWNWAAATGLTKSGAVVGFNLTAHRPLDGQGDTHSVEDSASDCALWLNGALLQLSGVTFVYDSKSPDDVWLIRDASGHVDLTFQPLGERADHINFGVVESRFRQPYGRFSGKLIDAQGETYAFEDIFGVTEEHLARW